MEKGKILIIGGSGFIGTHLTKSLLDKSYQVKILDLKEPSADGVEYLKGSVRNSSDVNRAVPGCDYVFHLASMMSVRETEKNPLGVLNTNIDGTRNVLEACRKKDVKKIIFTSSSEVYGEAGEVPVTEESPLKPKSCYGISKVVCEEYIKSYSKVYGLPFLIVRYFNIYGPGQSTNFVASSFVKLALENEPLTIYGDGEQVRAFTFVGDAVNGTLLGAFNGPENQIFNIGNDKEPIKIKELAEKILEITNSESELKFIPMEKSDRSVKREIYQRIPSIDKARKLLNYEPEVSLKEGLSKVIKYFKSLK